MSTEDRLALQRHIEAARNTKLPPNSRLYQALLAITILLGERGDIARRVKALAYCDCHEHFPAEIADGWRCPIHHKEEA